MSRIANWLRWPLVPPLSLAAAYLVALAISLADSGGAVVAYAAAFASGVGYMWAALVTAHMVAPSHRRMAVTVLGVFILGDMVFVHLITPPDFFEAMASEQGMSLLLGLLGVDRYGHLPNGGAVLVAGVAVGLATALWKLFKPRRGSRAAPGLVLLGSFLFLGACGSDLTVSDAHLVLHNVTVLSPRTGSIQRNRSVLVAGERIVAIVPSSDVSSPPTAEVVEGNGQYLIPGLWDLHTHFSYADPNAGPLLVTQGVTGVRDMGSVLEVIEATRRQFESNEVLGPRIIRAGPTLNGDVFAEHHRLIDSPEAARAAVADLDSIGVDVLKTHNATGRETYFALLEAAEDVGLKVVGHVPVSVTPLEACERGQGSIDHIVTLFEGAYAARFETEVEAFRGMESWLETEAQELVRCLVIQGTLFVPTLYTYHFRAHRAELYASPPDGWSYLSSAGRMAYREQLAPTESDLDSTVVRLRVGLVEIGKAFTRMAYEAGANIGTGTDFAGPGPVPGFSVRSEIELLADAGLPPHAALWAAVRGPGVEAGADPLTGEIVAGAPADLVLLGANPFEDVEALVDIVGVSLRGRWLERSELDRTLERLSSR